MKITRDKLLESDFNTLFTRDPGTFFEAILINILWDKSPADIDQELVARQKYVFLKWHEYFGNALAEDTRKELAKMSLIFVDVEATGASPIKGTLAEFGAVDYKTRETFYGRIWASHPDPENPAKPVLERQLNSLFEVMDVFSQWVADHTGKNRAIFVSDNPAYDWQWISAAFDMCDMPNPFGHSARHIGDFWAGIQHDFYATQAWKSYRVTPHTHNPVDDAMGNVEAFERITKELKGQ